MATNRADPNKPAARKPTRSKAVLPPETKTYEHPEANTPDLMIGELLKNMRSS